MALLPFIPNKRTLQSEDLHRPRGVARSGLRPLPKLLDCCPPWGYGPYLNPIVADHPLRPAIHHSHGRPLPCHLANGARAHPWTEGPCGSPPLLAGPCDPDRPCGISPGFPGLSPIQGQVAHVLLTHSPLYSPPEGDFRVRLACLIHAASVHSEPGSNSPKSLYRLIL